MNGAVLRGRAAERVLTAAGTIVCLVAGAACSGASVAGDDTGLEPLVDDWRGVLLSRGGELPFDLRVDGEGSDPPAIVRNGDIETPMVAVTRQGAASYTLHFFGDEEPIDSELVVKMAPNGDELHGFWRLRHLSVTDDAPREPLTQMPFTAKRNDPRRFQRNDPTLDVATAAAIAALPEVAGVWEISSSAEGIDLNRVARLLQTDERVIGEIDPQPGGATPLRLEGIYRNGLLRLSTFDGRVAVLLHARATPAGTLEGQVWVADRPAAAWSARRVPSPR